MNRIKGDAMAHIIYAQHSPDASSSDIFLIITPTKPITEMQSRFRTMNVFHGKAEDLFTSSLLQVQTKNELISPRSTCQRFNEYSGWSFPRKLQDSRPIYTIPVVVDYEICLQVLRFNSRFI